MIIIEFSYFVPSLFAVHTDCCSLIKDVVNCRNDHFMYNLSLTCKIILGAHTKL
jgi:hypothetical protein